MKTKGKIELTYKCDQDWDTMSMTDKGRHCQVCETEVVDFSSMTDDQLKSFFTSQKVVCGKFSLQQIHPEIIAPIQIPRSFRIAAFLSFFSLSNLKSATNPETPKVELHQALKTEASTLNTLQSSYKSSTKRPGPLKLFSIKKNTYYLTRRFPFIITIKNGGGWLMGNPRFL